MKGNLRKRLQKFVQAVAAPVNAAAYWKRAFERGGWGWGDSVFFLHGNLFMLVGTKANRKTFMSVLSPEERSKSW